MINITGDTWRSRTDVRTVLSSASLLSLPVKCYAMGRCSIAPGDKGRRTVEGWQGGEATGDRIENQPKPPERLCQSQAFGERCRQQRRPSLQSPDQETHSTRLHCRLATDPPNCPEKEAGLLKGCQGATWLSKAEELKGPLHKANTVPSAQRHILYTPVQQTTQIKRSHAAQRGSRWTVWKTTQTLFDLLATGDMSSDLLWAVAQRSVFILENTQPSPVRSFFTWLSCQAPSCACPRLEQLRREEPVVQMFEPWLVCQWTVNSIN